jgi:xylulokinase
MNADGWILAIDLGNGGPKVGIIDRDDQFKAVVIRPVGVHIGLDGAATQDAVEWWTTLVEATHAAIAAAGVSGEDLHAVAITGQYASTVPVDADGEPVGEVLLWADTRGGKYAREVIGGPVSYQGFAPQRVIPWIRKTGGAPTPSGADPTGHSLLLQREFPEIHARAAYLMEPLDYLGMRFTGRAATTPATMLASWLTDNRPGRDPSYDEGLVARAKRDPEKLPPLLPTGSVLGPVSPEVAVDLGVRAGVPVVTGLPDLHAAVLGSGAVEPFATHLTISTTAWISTRVNFKKTDILHMIATVPGLDHEHPLVVNNIETGGAALRWLKEQVFPELDYDELTKLAAGAPAGCEGTMFTPWLNGERSPVEDHRLRASFLNVSLRTNRATMIRAVMEGVALNARWLFDYYVKFLGQKPPYLRIIGGGAQSDLWCQIHAYALGVPLERPSNPRDAQLRGAALWARICLGEMTVQEAGQRVVVTDTFRPDGPDELAYAAQYDEFRRLYGSLGKTQKRLSRLAESRA